MDGRSETNIRYPPTTSLCGGYDNRNPTLGVLWSWHRVASLSIEITIQIWKKNVRWQITQKLQKKHPYQTSPTTSGHFTLQAEPENKLKQLYFNGAVTVSTIFQQSAFTIQGKSEGFDSCDRPSNLTQIGFKSLIFHPV